MSKFSTQLSGTHRELRESRANSAAKQASSAQDELVSSLRREVGRLELDIESHTDIAPTSSIQLRLENFDAKSWVERLQDLKIQLLEARAKLQVAEDTRREWFDETK